MSMDLMKWFPGSHLHVLLWDRFDPKHHQAGMNFLVSLMKNPDFDAYIMPMLRPIGRIPQDYLVFEQVFQEMSGGRLPDQPAPGNTPYLNCCEVWLQVAEEQEEPLWNEMASWGNRQNLTHWRVWRSAAEPVSRPFGDDMLFDPNLPNDYTEEQKAALAKVIWFRATGVIVEWLSTGQCHTQLHLTDPGDRKAVAEALKRVTDTLRYGDYGLPDSGGSPTTDPSRLRVSHMPAFAINAITKVADPSRWFYQLEQYLRWDYVSYPYLYPSRANYLSHVHSIIEADYGVIPP